MCATRARSTAIPARPAAPRAAAPRRGVTRAAAAGGDSPVPEQAPTVLDLISQTRTWQVIGPPRAAGHGAAARFRSPPAARPTPSRSRLAPAKRASSALRPGAKTGPRPEPNQPAAAPKHPNSA